MIATISQHPRQYILPLIAATGWTVMLASAISNVAKENETALKIAQYSALASVATTGLAAVFTLGKAIHAGATNGASHFCKTLIKSMSPIDRDAPPGERCNIGKPDALFWNTFTAAVAGPFPWFFAICENRHDHPGVAHHGAASHAAAPPPVLDGPLQVATG